MPSVYDIELYRTESGRAPVKEYLKNLQNENKLTELSQIDTFIERLQMHGMGVNSIYPHTIRKESPKGIWELRPGGNRVFFFHFTGEKFVLLHAYKKQSQQTPPSEIRQAEKEMKDYLRRTQHE
jgi:phage-related protein